MEENSVTINGVKYLLVDDKKFGSCEECDLSEYCSENDYLGWNFSVCDIFRDKAAYHHFIKITT